MPAHGSPAFLELSDRFLDVFDSDLGDFGDAVNQFLTVDPTRVNDPDHLMEIWWWNRSLFSQWALRQSDQWKENVGAGPMERLNQDLANMSLITLGGEVWVPGSTFVDVDLTVANQVGYINQPTKLEQKTFVGFQPRERTGEESDEEDAEGEDLATCICCGEPVGPGPRREPPMTMEWCCNTISGEVCNKEWLGKQAICIFCG